MVIHRLDEPFKFIAPFEVLDETGKMKKAPDANKIISNVLKELSPKGMMLLTLLYNVCLRLESILKSIKDTQIIMIKKPDKVVLDVNSYRPISLLPTIEKLFEKFFFTRLKLQMKIPDHRFGFRAHYFRLNQIHRITTVIKKDFEEKKIAQQFF